MRTRWGVAGLSAVALLAWGPAGTAHAGIACGAFHHVASPDGGSVSNEVAAVDAASAHAAWAVGTWGTASQEGALILRFNGAHWILQKPAVAAGAVNLQAVAARTPTDVWAVGQHLVENPDGSGIEQTFALHWNGTAWRHVPTPNVGSLDNSLRGAAAVNDHDVWAVGDHLTGGLGDLSQAIRWNGSSWDSIPVEQVGGSFNAFSGIAGIPGTRRVWAAGEWADGNSDPLHTLIEQAC